MGEIGIGIERGREHARGGGLARADFAGKQAHAWMPRQQLEPALDLLPTCGGKQLFGVGAVGERGFLEAEECLKHYR